MKVLLTNPPWKKSDERFGVRAGSRWPFTQRAKKSKALNYIPFPFFLAYAAALLEKERGLEVKAIDAIAEGLTDDEYFEKLLSFRPDLILAETSAASFSEDLHYAEESKSLLGDNIIYVLAGPHVTIFPEETLAENPTVDCCLLGEYEWTFRELVLFFKSGHIVPENIKGLAYRNSAGKIIVNERRPLGDIKELPMPAWHHFPMMNYKDYFCGIPAPMANMLASRGCPYRCSFCLWPDVMYGSHSYRTRETESIVDEMEYLVKKYGFKTIYFDDDTFNIGKHRILEICSEIKKRGLKVCWAVMARADTMDEEIIVAMKEAGLCAVKYGVETGSQHILDLTGKKLNLDKVKNIVKSTKNAGIKVHLTFTVGLPGETHKTIRKSIAFALALDPDSIQLSLATPFPGTRYYNEALEKGYLLQENSSLYDGALTCVVRTDELTVKEIEGGFEKFKKAWLFHKMKKALTSPYIIVEISKNWRKVLTQAKELIRGNS